MTRRDRMLRISHDNRANGANGATLEQLAVMIDHIFPFARIADAFDYLEQGHAKGKVVVQMVEQLGV